MGASVPISSDKRAAVPSTVGAYLKWIRDSAPKLTAEQMRALRQRMREAEAAGDTTGRDAARKQLVAGNLGLVVSIAKRYVRPGVIELDELISEGNIGLLLAVDKWDETRGAFSTIATQWIRKQILVALDERAAAIHIPADVRDMRARLRRAQIALELQHGREPTDDELRLAANLKPLQMASVRLAERAAVIESLDVPLPSGAAAHTGALGDSVDGKTRLDLLAADEIVEMRERLPALFAERLSAREEAIVRLRHDAGLPYLRIAQAFGIDVERVCAIEHAAMAKVRVELARVNAAAAKLIAAGAPMPSAVGAPTTTTPTRRRPAARSGAAKSPATQPKLFDGDSGAA